MGNNPAQKLTKDFSHLEVLVVGERDLEGHVGAVGEQDGVLGFFVDEGLHPHGHGQARADGGLHLRLLDLQVSGWKNMDLKSLVEKCYRLLSWERA